MIAIIIPTLNEEEAIQNVVRGFPEEYGGHKVERYIIDGGSTDKTISEAREAGAKVIEQTLGVGKGNGVRECLERIEADIYVMIDGDGTYEPSEMSKLVNPVINGESEHVIGRRTRREKGSIPKLNLAGNKIFNLVTRLATRKDIRDMLSGYRAFTRESLKYTEVTKPGFGIETEMTFTALENNVPIKEVDISYSERAGESKLNPLSDGWRIFSTLVWSIRDMNPLKFFSSISILLLVIGAYPGFITVKQKFTTGYIQDLGPAIAAGVLVILAVQFFIFGLLADQIKNIEKRLKSSL